MALQRHVTTQSLTLTTFTAVPRSPHAKAQSMRRQNGRAAHPLSRRPTQALCLAVCAGLALSACSSSHSTTTHSASSHSASSSAAQPVSPTSASNASNDPATIVLPSGAAAANTVLASVAGQAITAAEVRTLMARKSPNVALPDPPQYLACTARLKREATSPASTEARELIGKSQAQLGEVCRGHYEDLLRSALATAIHTRWLLGEAHRDAIHVSARAVAQEFKASKESFHSSSEFDSYMKDSGRAFR